MSVVNSLLSTDVFSKLVSFYAHYQLFLLVGFFMASPFMSLFILNSETIMQDPQDHFEFDLTEPAYMLLGNLLKMIVEKSEKHGDSLISVLIPYEDILEIPSNSPLKDKHFHLTLTPCMGNHNHTNMPEPESTKYS